LWVVNNELLIVLLYPVTGELCLLTEMWSAGRRE